MTTRYNTITVTLADPVRSDDIQAYIDAIELMHGVETAEPGTPDNMELYTAKRQVRQEAYEAWSEVFDFP